MFSKEAFPYFASLAKFIPLKVILLYCLFYLVLFYLFILINFIQLYLMNCIYLRLHKLTHFVFYEYLARFTHSHVTAIIDLFYLIFIITVSAR